MFNLTVDRAFFPHLIMTPLIGDQLVWVMFQNTECQTSTYPINNPWQ